MGSGVVASGNGATKTITIAGGSGTNPGFSTAGGNFTVNAGVTTVINTFNINTNTKLSEYTIHLENVNGNIQSQKVLVMNYGAGIGLTAVSYAGDGSALTGISAGVTVQDEGSALSTAGTTLNFVGSGVVASGSGATKTITIAGGGGSGNAGFSTAGGSFTVNAGVTTVINTFNINTNTKLS